MVDSIYGNSIALLLTFCFLALHCFSQVYITLLWAETAFDYVLSDCAHCEWGSSWILRFELTEHQEECLLLHERARNLELYLYYSPAGNYSTLSVTLAHVRHPMSFSPQSESISG